MNEGLIPARYAKALYLVAREKAVDRKLYESMKTLEQSFVARPDLQNLLSNPYISDEDKISLLKTAAGADSSDTVFCDFLKLLARNRRLSLARGAANAYVALFRRENKIFDVKITSASKMSEAEQKRLLDIIGSHLNGATIELTTKVDPELIGGFTVNVGNERIDASVSNELKQLRLNLISK